MRRPTLLARLCASTLLALAPTWALAQNGARSGDGAVWLGEELPLPLAVKTPADLALKAAAERQYLVFNLLARGKLAWDAGDYATAAAKWDALLKLSNLDPELTAVVKPLLTEARSRGGAAATTTAAPIAVPVSPTPAAAPAATGVVLSGTVSGGGPLGPGGTVVWLKRTDGSTPRPAPARGKVLSQINKTFVPRVLPVTVGTKVAFKNADPIFHNVFSLSKPNDFDTGLYKGGGSYEKTFAKPGAVQLLCNIHASMIGYVVVVDSPWCGQADGGGAFTIRGVPPGEYELFAWHEASSQTTRQKVTIADVPRPVAVRVSGDRKPLTLVPDKAGKPRQVQLGY